MEVGTMVVAKFNQSNPKTKTYVRAGEVYEVLDIREGNQGQEIYLISGSGKASWYPVSHFEEVNSVEFEQLFAI